MRGSWDLGGSCIRLRPKDRFALTEPMCGISAQFGHASIRSPSRENASIISFGPKLEWNRINGDQIFCTRDRAWEAYFALFLSTAERRLTADHLNRFSVRVIAHGRHLSLSFYLPPSVGLLLTIWTDFLYA